MNIFFDTEFTGLVPGTTLISIGMVTQWDVEFYAEFTDYNKGMCDSWIRENVLDNLVFSKANMVCGKNIEKYHVLTERYMKNDIWEGNMYVRGDRQVVRHNLIRWLKQFGEERIQLISDVCHYDMVLFCNLFNGAFGLPKNINPVCYDICQDICARAEKGDLDFNNRLFSSMESYNEYERHFRSDRLYWWADTGYMMDAFNISRETLCEKHAGYLPETFGSKHNSLYDAKVIKLIYEGMRG